VVLFDIESQAELDEIRRAIARPPRPLAPHSTHAPVDAYADRP
jgi:hypothetical protein